MRRISSASPSLVGRDACQARPPACLVAKARMYKSTYQAHIVTLSVLTCRDSLMTEALRNPAFQDLMLNDSPHELDLRTLESPLN
jgi:hypothetical protein